MPQGPEFIRCDYPNPLPSYGFCRGAAPRRGGDLQYAGAQSRGLYRRRGRHGQNLCGPWRHGIVRYQQPEARIVVLAPRENIQLKWIKELRNFIRDNWRVEDNRVKNLNHQPIRPPIACHSFDDLARLLRVDDACDLFLRATTFRVAVKTPEGQERCRARLLPYIPWVDQGLLSASEPKVFRDMYGRVLNALIPDIDLLVVDEAHNFKHGFGEHVSNRNRLLGLGLGHPDGGHPDCEWYGPRVKRVLMLSATPFEYDYADLYQQLDVFGFGDVTFGDANAADPIAAKQLLV